MGDRDPRDPEERLLRRLTRRERVPAALAGPRGAAGTPLDRPLGTFPPGTVGDVWTWKDDGGDEFPGWEAPSAGTGDVVGPSASVDGEIALYDGMTGKLLKRATGSGVVKAASGVYSTGATINDLGAQTADYSANSHKITNVTDPTSAQDAATKAYVDGVATGLDLKASVRAATVAALPSYGRTGNVITASANGALAAIDGVTLVAGDRLLLKDGAAGADNGIYVVTAVGDASNPFVLTRAGDAGSSAEVTSGLFTFATEGTANGDKGWVLTTNDPITLNTTALTFAQFSSSTVDIAATIHAASSKATPVDADETALVDSVASNVLKKLTWANLKATLKTYFDGLYSALGHTHTATIAPTVNLGDGTNVLTSSEPFVLIYFPVQVTITEVHLNADASGSATLGIAKSGSGAPTSFTSIVASAPPTLSSQQSSSDTTLTGWTTTVEAGRWLKVTVTGTPATIKRLAMGLVMTRTV
jgi:hypothetical protein